MEMRTELAKTLYSELGSGSPDRVHIRQLERFASVIGLQQQDLECTVPIPEVTTYLDTLRRLYLDSGHLTALGAALAVETTAASEFEYFVPGLKQYEQFQPGELEFLRYIWPKNNNTAIGWSRPCARRPVPRTTCIAWPRAPGKPPMPGWDSGRACTEWSLAPTQPTHLDNSPAPYPPPKGEGKEE